MFFVVLCIGSCLAMSSPLDAMSLIRNIGASAKRATCNTRMNHYRSSIPVRRYMCNKEAFDTSAAELRNHITKAEFSLIDAEDLIQAMPSTRDLDPFYTAFVKPCEINGIVQFIVDHAVQNPTEDAKYAHTLWLLHKHLGWNITSQCCAKTMLHTAVKHNLSHVTEALVLAEYWRHPNVQDDKKRTVLHYAQTPEMVEYLLKNIVDLDINAQDVDGNTPLHLAPACMVDTFYAYNADLHKENYMPFVGFNNQTPLCKAIVEADMAKFKALIRWPEAIMTHKRFLMVRDVIQFKLYETVSCSPENERYRHMARMLEEI